MEDPLGLVAGRVNFLALFADSWAKKNPFNFRKHTRPVPPFGRAGKLAENLKTTFSTKTPLFKKNSESGCDS